MGFNTYGKGRAFFFGPRPDIDATTGKSPDPRSVQGRVIKFLVQYAAFKIDVPQKDMTKRSLFVYAPPFSTVVIVLSVLSVIVLGLVISVRFFSKVDEATATCQMKCCAEEGA